MRWCEVSFIQDSRHRTSFGRYWLESPISIRAESRFCLGMMENPVVVVEIVIGFGERSEQIDLP